VSVFFPKPAASPDWSKALRHLRRDPVMKGIIARVGPCTLAPRQDYFVKLCQSIYAQQISTKIATVLYGRFAAMFPRKTPTPAKVVAALSPGGWDDETVRRCGLSRQKRAYVLDLARHFADRRIDARNLHTLDDESIIAALTEINGVGRWTAEMFLIFVLNRPDVLPVDDLGLREGVRRSYGLSERPKADVVRRIAEPWRPWRTIATWYLWRGLSLEHKDNNKDKTSHRETESQRKKASQSTSSL
jgi:DNA-3-methyladenine glycosylase II